MIKLVKDYRVFDYVKIVEPAVNMVIWEGEFADIPCEYRYRTVSSIEYSDGVAEITIDVTSDNKKKFWFRVGTCGEDSDEGYIKLTMAEAILVQKVVDKDNWYGISGGGYVGSFWIDIDSAVDAETYEKTNYIPEETMNIWR